MKKALLLLLLPLVSFAQVVIEDSTGKRFVIPNGLYRQVMPVPVSPVLPPVLPNCGCQTSDFTILAIQPKGDAKYEIQFDACNVSPLTWTVANKAGTFVPTSSKFTVDLSGVAAGEYNFLITSTGCKGKAQKTFRIEPVIVPPTQSNQLVALGSPLAATFQMQGQYEIKYIESREDEHLKIKISQEGNKILLTEYGSSLQSSTITFNGWTDLNNASKLENEPIQPYTLYHISKWSVAAGSLREWWKALYLEPRAQYKRSELFFYVVPKGENWNPAGDSPNPIGRPAAFSKVPQFKLKDRIYGFEYSFLDESAARLDDLNITFNRKKGSQHLKLYAGALSSFLRNLPSRKGFEDLTERECVDFANTLPIEAIVAFDIEPGEGEAWIINYDGANFERNMGIVIDRLKERGAMAYNWLDVPSKSPNNISFDGTIFGTGGGYGKDFVKFGEIYKRLNNVSRKNNPYSVIATGYGYNSYDTNFGDNDAGTINTSPQYTYLRSLDVSELWSRVWPEKEQVYFSWAFQEFDFVGFPPNHVVDVPEYNARARRTDNKPLYPPNHWEDNMTLSLITSKYLFYWSPGPVGWNPANVSSYNKAYTNGGFSVWDYEQGRTPETGKFYIGKEATAINATISAAYNFSRVQDAADGLRYAPAFTWQRAGKNGNIEITNKVDAITDGSWYNQALGKKQQFAIVLENNSKKVLFFQDVWARPGLWTDFSVMIDGKEYKGRTNGNRLFTTIL